jgi:hypothetical protein
LERSGGVALSDSDWQWICTLVPVIDFIVFFSGDAALRGWRVQIVR